VVEFITVFPVRYHFKKSSYVNRQQKIVELKKSRKSRANSNSNSKLELDVV